MRGPEYLSLNNGKVYIDCNSVPDKGFLDAIMTKDIAKVKILSAKNKMEIPDYTPGSPDVLINHITGEREYITRSLLNKQYNHASGNKIRLGVLKNDTWYLVYSPCKVQYKIIKLPDNCVAVLPNGNVAKNGSYIVCKQDENGQAIRDSIQSISPKLFRKMFIIPMQPAIKRSLNGKHSTEFTMFNDNKVKSAKPKKVNFDSSELGMNTSNINIKTVQEEVNDNNKTVFKPSFDRINTHNNQINNQNKYKYTVVNRITDIDNKLIGYVLMEIQSGKKKNLKPNDLAKFCAAKAVDNVMLVTREDGVQFLKGNGIRLENLPAVLL